MDKTELQKHEDRILHLSKSYFTSLEVSQPVCTLTYILNCFLETEGSQITFTEGQQITKEVTNLIAFLVEVNERVRDVRKIEFSKIKI